MAQSILRSTNVSRCLVASHQVGASGCPCIFATPNKNSIISQIKVQVLRQENTAGVFSATSLLDWPALPRRPFFYLGRPFAERRFRGAQSLCRSRLSAVRIVGCLQVWVGFSIEERIPQARQSPSDGVRIGLPIWSPTANRHGPRALVMSAIRCYSRSVREVALSQKAFEEISEPPQR